MKKKKNDGTKNPTFCALQSTLNTIGYLTFSPKRLSSIPLTHTVVKYYLFCFLIKIS